MHRATDSSTGSVDPPHQLGEDPVERCAPRDRVPMSPVRREDVVVLPQGLRGPRRDRLHPQVKVARPRDQGHLEVELLNLLLEPPD